jgi:dCMP deaminase
MLPSPDEYFMEIAIAVRKRANCKGSRVGAIVVNDSRIVSTGYNGTPDNMQNCLEGGCYRCANRDKYPSGTGYDLCICVHAEQNALLSAARLGIAVEGSSVYCTMRPCFGCTKEMLQAKIASVFYLNEWAPLDETKRAEYERIQNRFPGGIRRVNMIDPEATGAIPTKEPTSSGVTDETGHTVE